MRLLIHAMSEGCRIFPVSDGPYKDAPPERGNFPHVTLSKSKI